MARGGDAFQEFLVIRNPYAGGIRQTEWVNAIESDAGLPEPGRGRDDGAEKLLLAFSGKLNVRSRKQGPSRTEPNHELSTRSRLLVFNNRGQGFHREIETIGCAIESLRSINGPQSGFVLIVERRQSIPVARGAVLDLRSSVGKNDERYRQGQLASVLQQKLLKFNSFIIDSLKGSIDRVDHQNNFNWRIRRRARRVIHGVKREDVFRLLIVEKSEVLFLQSTDRHARFVCHLHIERDLPVRSARRWERRPGGPGLELGWGSVLLGRGSVLRRGSVLLRYGSEWQKQHKKPPKERAHPDSPRLAKLRPKARSFRIPTRKSRPGCPKKAMTAPRQSCMLEQSEVIRGSPDAREIAPMNSSRHQ